MNVKLQKQLEGLSARVAKLQKDFGVVEKAGTPANDPPIPEIDGVRAILDRMNAASILRAKQDTRTALLKDPLFLTLMRAMQKDPRLQADLIAAIERAERNAGGPEGVQPPAGPYDIAAFNADKERARVLALGKEAISMTADVKKFVAALQAIADHFAAGGQSLPAGSVAKMAQVETREQTAMDPHPIQKSATDTTRANVQDLGRPRRMHLSEILR